MFHTTQISSSVALQVTRMDEDVILPMDKWQKEYNTMKVQHKPSLAFHPSGMPDHASPEPSAPHPIVMALMYLSEPPLVHT